MISIGAARSAITSNPARFVLPTGPLCDLAVRALSLAGFLALWWAVVAAKLIDQQFLPSPHAVWDAFVRANSWHQLAPGVPREVPGEQNYSCGSISWPACSGSPSARARP
ncbi:hypothetical protein ACQP1O_24775 [Nocardia sp. CA-151230]|uniref:hypothetical protein n=1 Tax=Nocardia sp. CA-151230 TaxID=3239982 RepID=UPI003D90A4D1